MKLCKRFLKQHLLHFMMPNADFKKFSPVYLIATFLIETNYRVTGMQEQKSKALLTGRLFRETNNGSANVFAPEV